MTKAYNSGELLYRQLCQTDAFGERPELLNTGLTQTEASSCPHVCSTMAHIGDRSVSLKRDDQASCFEMNFVCVYATYKVRSHYNGRSVNWLAVTWNATGTHHASFNIDTKVANVSGVAAASDCLYPMPTPMNEKLCKPRENEVGKVSSSHAAQRPAPL